MPPFGPRVGADGGAVYGQRAAVGDATCAHGGHVTANGAVGHVRCAAIADAAAAPGERCVAAGSCVAGDAAAGDGQRAAVAIADATVKGGRVVTDDTVGDVGCASIADAAAAPGERCVAANSRVADDRAVGER